MDIIYIYIHDVYTYIYMYITCIYTHMYTYMRVDVYVCTDGSRPGAYA